MSTFKVYSATVSNALTSSVSNGSGMVGGNGSYLHVFGGVPPTAAQFATWVYTNLPTTKLVTFDISNKGLAPINSACGFANVAAANAINSGTATWFAAVQIAAGSSDPMLMGDISDLSGTGAFRLSDTIIVAGQTYTMQNLTMYFPNTFVF